MDLEPILTLTINPVVDKSTSIDRVAPEMKLRCDAPTREPGGGGINVSRAIVRLGGASTAVYPSGGFTGKLLEELLAEEDVVQRPLPVKNLTRENFIVFERVTGQQYRFGMPGAHIAEAEWRACLDFIETFDPTPKYIVGSGSLPPGAPIDFYAHLAGVAERIGARMILDTSGDALQVAMQEDGTYHPVYLLKPNMRELAQLAGVEIIESEQEQEGAARMLIERGKTEVVVVSLGAAGALLVTKDRVRRYRAPTVPIRSAVGAGDSMVGGIVLKLAQGAPVEDAARYGIAAGSAAVMTEGTQLCRLEDTEMLYKRITTAEA